MSPTIVPNNVTAHRRATSAILLGAVFVSAVGDEISLIACMVHLAKIQQSLLVAALLLLQLAPAVLLAPLTGQLLDRRNAGRVLALASLFQALVLFAMSTWPNASVLLVGSAAVGIFGAVSAPAAIVLIPVAVGQAFPARANGLLELSRSASTLVGPVVGGALVTAVGIKPALLVDAVSFALAAGAIALARVNRPVEESGQAWWKGATDGLRFLARQGDLRALLPVLIFTVSASAMVNVATVFFVKGPLHSDGTVLGLLTAAWGAGALVGATMASRREWHVPERAVLFAAAAQGLAILLYGAFTVVGVALVMALCSGVANAYQNIAMRTSVQVRAPEELRGRAHAAAGSVVNTFFLVGYAVGGAFAATSPQLTFIVGGAVTLAAGCAGLLREAQRHRKTPEGSQAANLLKAEG
ncbi:MFS transporter [Streptomyces sp. NPDC002685]|uniref:MFS transporter n=1 Tax=Streptomyces sp. NPDC002685 TaxID=3154540 RepID=UPI003331B91D